MNFSCDAGFEDGAYDAPRPRRFLKADYTIDCDSPEHRQYESYALLMLCVYPLGIPLLYFVLLYRSKAKVDPLFDEADLEGDLAMMAGRTNGPPPMHRGNTAKQLGEFGGAYIKLTSLAALVASRNKAKDEAEAGAFYASISTMKQVVGAELRHHDPSIAHLEFLWGAYEPRCWYWEVVESVRRLMLTGMLVFCMPDSATQIVIGILIAIFSIFMYGKMGPYVRDQDDTLAGYAQYVEWGALLLLLLLRTTTTN